MGSAPEGTQVAHSDGDPLNNKLSNLRWATAKENMADQFRHGTRIKGEGHPRARLTEADVRKIRENLAAGMTQASQCREYGVSIQAMWALANGKTWRHVV
ncbi:HNH endonuclease [Streptomyces sp. A1-5]|nr:HNH endonuclease [Streptomyces sp. A1-5]